VSERPIISWVILEFYFNYIGSIVPLGTRDGQKE
jgi:hypothetical protein